LREGHIVTSCLLLVIVVVAAVADANQEKLGDVSDGSRSIAVHLIPLLGNDPVDEKAALPISPDDEPLLPFSMRRTCSECHVQEHTYELISRGWHFNAADPNVPPGRPGQPWILADPTIATQIPVSYRPWPGTFQPAQLGLTEWQFIQHFGRHMPGGGVGEKETTDRREIMRQFISGKLEINCLHCHDASPAYDQAEYASQIARQNLRWAATAACEFAAVSGTASEMADDFDYAMPDMVDDPKLIPLVPTVTYRENAFDDKKQAFFDIVGRVPNERCYFCHSNADVNEEVQQKWAADEDVHLTAGLKCVDCHRNGIDHNIIRGYAEEADISQNPLAATSTCEACHLPQGQGRPEAGRLGAPVPTHPGIPTIHFEKLTCTACHSGPWPARRTRRVKTSRAHALGTHNVNKSPGVLPHIIYPVLAKEGPIGAAYVDGLLVLSLDGKIAPHKLIWPAYWAAMKDEQVTPIALEVVRKTVGKVITPEKLSRSGDWPSLTEQDITEALNSLGEAVEAKPVYVCGGSLYRLDDSGQLCEEKDHAAAKPYMWPLAHNVRPAAQSLGIRRCEDCHATDGPFFFGKVAVDSPLDIETDSVKKMVEFQQIDAFYAWAFAFSFVFRPWLKVVTLASCTVLAGVLLLYALKMLTCIAKVLVGQDE